MSIYRRGRVWWVRWMDPDGNIVQQTTKTRNKVVAEGMDRMLYALRSAREWDVLRAIADGKVTLGTVYDLRVNLTAVHDQINDIDLKELAQEWRTANRARKLQSAEKYYAQVSSYLLSAPMRSQFTPASVSRWTVTSLFRVSRSTKNRYRAALSSFGSWLVEREILTSNPVRGTKGYRPDDPRKAHLSRTETKRLILALASPYREMAALMAGTGMEAQAVLRLRARDVDVKSRVLWANGGKNKWRQRFVRFTESSLWTVFAPALRGKSSNALVFGRGDPVRDATLGGSLDYHVRKTLGLPAFQGIDKIRPHDFRHCYAIWNLRDGMNPQTVRHQLGHRLLSTTLDIYGAYIPDRDSDYELPAKRHGRR